MAAVMQAFDIPVELQHGIATGLYKVWGGVVRWAVGPNKGQIVKHLKPIEIEEVKKVNPSVVEKVAQAIKANKKAFIIGTATIVILSTSAGLFVYFKNKKCNEEIAFRLSLYEYIEALRNATLNESHIDKLLSSMENLKSSKKFEKIKLQLTMQDLDAIINRINEFTLIFAEDNHFEIDASKSGLKNSDSIVCLKNSLNLQKQIFRKAA